MRLRANHPALEYGVTIHPKTVKPLNEYTSRLLKPASGNAKLGAGSNLITKGKWSGMPMYTLTLEERSTCSRTCQQWDRCFGNNMGFAHRVDSSDPELLEMILNDELDYLAGKHPQGFVVRLHVLGDFFSTDYVNFWADALRAYHSLHVFGYTHRTDGPIAEAIADNLQTDRAWIRWSDRGGPMSANVHGEGITCPEQTGKTSSCLTCGLCWTTTKAIAFIEH